MTKMIFVFGSNEAGRHGAGAARYALLHKGAKYHQGVGLSGQSYAIPTKDLKVQTLSKERIREYVDAFIAFAQCRSDLVFQVTALGCGLADYKHEDIAPMFIGAPNNCLFDKVWKPWLDNVKFWGTF